MTIFSLRLPYSIPILLSMSVATARLVREESSAEGLKFESNHALIMEYNFNNGIYPASCYPPPPPVPFFRPPRTD